MPKFIIYISLLLCTIHNIIASSKFEVINNLSGLRSDYISGMCQDERGFIWIATIEGLSRYDGVTVKYFSPFLSNDSIAYVKEIQSIKSDHNGIIWLGSANGLFSFDPIIEQFNAIDIEALPSHEILVMEVDKIGRVWMGNKLGLYIYDPHSDKLEHVPVKNHSPKNLSVNIRSLLCDSQGDMWIGYWSGNVCRYISKEERFQEIKIDAPKSSISTIFEHNGIYLGRWDGSIVHVPRGEECGKVVQRLGDSNKIIPIHSIFYEEHNDRFWIATGNGIYKVGSLNSPCSVENFTASSQQHRLKNNNVASILYTPKDQLLWFGTRGGGVNYTSLADKYITSTTLDQINDQHVNGGVRAIYDDATQLWIALQTGGLYTKKGDDDFKKQSFGSNKINTIRKLKGSNELWIGNRGEGITIVNLDTHESTTLELRDYPNVITLYESSNGWVWIGCNNGLLVARRNGSEWIVEDLTAKLSYRQLIVGITERKQGEMWIATRRNGVYKLRYSDGVFESQRYEIRTDDGLIYNNILSIYCDNSERIWLGMSSLGLFKYDEKTDSFNLDKNVAGDDVGSVQSIIQQNDLLWLGTNHGLYCYDPNLSTSSLLRFTIDDGLINNICKTNSIATDNAGGIFVGAHNGFSHINRQITESISNDNLAIADIRINDKTLLYPNNTPIVERSQSENIEALRLKHNQRNLIIQLTTLTYSEHFNNRYKYILEGEDHKWREVNHSNQELKYNNLSWGKYRFRARSMDLDELQRDNITIDIVISRPLYARWWAILLYILVIGYVIYDMIDNRRARKILTQRLQIEVEQEVSEGDSDVESPTNRTAVALSSNIADEYQSVDEQLLRKAVEIVNQNIDNSEFDIAQFTEALGVTNSMLYRKIKSMTGMSPNEFIRHIRLQVAHKLITEKYKTITTSEAAYAVGFNIPKYFTKCFNKQFGMTPSQYRAQLLDKD